MMIKRGAIEFSMTTIIVIIIGVALLALGLVWISGTFSKLDTITESSLENAETILGESSFTGKIGVPKTIVMEGNDAKRYRINLRNIENSPLTIQVHASLVEEISTAGCSIKLVPDGAITDEVLLDEGETISVAGGILVYGCTNQDRAVIRIDMEKPLVLTGTPPVYASEAIAVQIT